MHIVLLSAEYPPAVGGVGDYTRQLAQALGLAGHEVAVVTGVADGFSQAAEEPDTAFKVLRRIRSWGWSLPGAVRDVLDELSPDIVHIQYQAGAYGMHPAVNFVPRRLGSRRPALLVTCHDLYMPYLFPKAGVLRSWVTRQLLEHADAVVVTNENDLRRLQGQGPDDPQRYRPRRPLVPGPAVIPIGSNIELRPAAEQQRRQRSELRAALGADQGAVLVAYFGLLSYSKGADLLLRALADLPERFRLVIIGGEATSPEDRRFAADFVEQVARHDLLERVQITGQLAEEEVTQHFLAADMTVLPFRDGASYRRGSLLAALTHGVPTITTYPALELTPPLDGAALLVPPDDVPALREALAGLAADAVLRRSLSDRAITLAGAFDWASIARRHEELYRQLLSRQRVPLAAK